MSPISVDLSRGIAGQGHKWEETVGELAGANSLVGGQSEEVDARPRGERLWEDREHGQDAGY